MRSSIGLIRHGPFQSFVGRHRRRTGAGGAGAQQYAGPSTGGNAPLRGRGAVLSAQRPGLDGIHGKQGDVLWIEVFSQRLGLTTDPIVLVQQVKRDDKGTETVVDLQSTDDVASNPAGSLFETASDDPEYRFVAPADGTYRVLVRDLYNASRADPRHVYRLSIRPAQPDFRLVAVPRFPPNNPRPQPDAQHGLDSAAAAWRGRDD